MMTQKTVNLKQLLRAFTLGVALVVGAGSVFAQNASTSAVNQPATQDIEQTWKSSPEFKRFNELGGEKSAEAMQIREETVKKIAEERLRPFIDGFDERIRERNREKINTYPATILVILSHIYENATPLIKDRSQKNMNSFNGLLLTYIDQVYNGTGKAELAGNALLKRFPELSSGLVSQIIISNGKAIDRLSAAIERTQAWNEIIKKLKALP